MSSFTVLLICILGGVFLNTANATCGCGSDLRGIGLDGLTSPYGPGPYGAGPYGAGPYGTGPYGAGPYGAGPYRAAEAAYGGRGAGNVGIAGELPVRGVTSVGGQVPIIGAVEYAGCVPASGVVTIQGSCAGGCGCGRY